MKWKLILTSRKGQNKRHAVLRKDAFPKLLKLLCDEIGLYENSTFISGFKATGINPLDRIHFQKNYLIS